MGSPSRRETLGAREDERSRRRGAGRRSWQINWLEGGAVLHFFSIASWSLHANDYGSSQGAEAVFAVCCAYGPGDEDV